ncbi:MAG: tryptophan-rich sensory protein [Rhodanobacteraceae bacterium]|nr:tryptophan-rich sensory protein [Rhodanobacteraceae bacterium]HPF74582.1 tryptophan-rich sensory protein [Xanthomonadaceae bacterium]HRY00885.1 tryptophan-rich sensory protein [Xanthomonadaceae bacterium]
MQTISQTRYPTKSQSRQTRWRPALVAALAVGVVLAIGGSFPPGEWFEALVKPTWQPPAWVFAPVWSVLYAMIAICLGLVLASPPGKERTLALWAMGVQLVLNAAWTPLFFGLQSPLLAFIDIAALWLATVVSIATVSRLSGLGSLLLVPALLWVSFALILNGVIMALNG